MDAIKTVQIPDDYKLVSFDVKSLFTSIQLQLALQCTETAIQQSTVTLTTVTDRRHHVLTEPLPYILQRQTLQAVAWNSHGVALKFFIQLSLQSAHRSFPSCCCFCHINLSNNFQVYK